MARTSFGTGFTIDVSELDKFAKQLRRVEPDIGKQLRVGLRDAGTIVQRSAQRRASWSTRIPSTVRVEARGARVKVRAGNTRAPHAAAFEHHGLAGQFRHPLFGNRSVWVNQKARPFLSPALEANQNEVANAVARAFDVVITELVRGH